MKVVSFLVACQCQFDVCQWFDTKMKIAVCWYQDYKAVHMTGIGCTTEQRLLQKASIKYAFRRGLQAIPRDTQSG